MTNTIYVPALAQMAHDFDVAPGRMQAVIACYLFPYGLLQFAYGPLSDRLGRRPLILTGVMLFILGSALAIMATHFETLLLASFIQGAGIAVAGVMVRTVMRDLYSGKRLHSANSIMAMVLIIFPLLAPIIGGVLADFFNWRAIFLFLTAYGACLFMLQWLNFKETNSHVGEPSRVWHKYLNVIKHRIFMINLLLLLIANGGVAVFEVSSGALFTAVLKLPPAIASLLFIVPLPFYMAGSFLAGILARHMSLDKLLSLGCIILALSGLAMLSLYYEFSISIIAILLPGSLFFLGAGLIFPTATTKALEEFPNIAGTAGAVLGGCQNLGAGILTAAAALIPLKSQLPLAVILTTLGICGFSMLLLQHRKR